jgi:hypothetical protein
MLQLYWYVYIVLQDWALFSFKCLRDMTSIYDVNIAQILECDAVYFGRYVLDFCRMWRQAAIVVFAVM